MDSILSRVHVTSILSKHRAVILSLQDERQRIEMLVGVSCGWGHPGGWMVTCSLQGNR